MAFLTNPINSKMKFFKTLFAITFFSLFLSCNQEIDKPDNLLGKAQMKGILQDIYLYKQIPKTKLLKDKKVTYNEINLSILKKHKVSLEQFQASLQYYVINDAAYDEILTEIKEDFERHLPQEEKEMIEDKNPTSKSKEAPKK